MSPLAIRPGLRSPKTSCGPTNALGRRLRGVTRGPVRLGASAEPRSAAEIRYLLRSIAADGSPEASPCDHLAQARALVEAGRASLR